MREHRTFKTEVVAHGAGGCQSTFEPSTAAACPLGVPIVRTDGRYSKAPQATETISKRRVKARHRELGREKVQKGAQRDAGEMFLSNILIATEQKKNLWEVLSKPSLTSKSKSASRSVGVWVDLLLRGFVVTGSVTALFGGRRNQENGQTLMLSLAKGTTISQTLSLSSQKVSSLVWLYC